MRSPKRLAWYDRNGQAVDLEECHSMGKKRGCRCGHCALCGYAQHTGIHGPVDGCEAVVGSAPWGHQYEPRQEKAQ